MKDCVEWWRIHPAAEDSMTKADFTSVMTAGSFRITFRKLSRILNTCLGCVVLPGLWSPMLNQTRRIDLPLRVTLPNLWSAGVLPGCSKQGAV